MVHRLLLPPSHRRGRGLLRAPVATGVQCQKAHKSGPGKRREGNAYESSYPCRVIPTILRLVAIGIALAAPLSIFGDCAETLGEVSAPGASVPFEIGREPDGSLILEFENVTAATGGFNIYRGHIGSF